MSSFGFRVFTLALAVFFFFETAIAGVKSASVYAESDSSGTSTYFRAGASVVSPVLSDGSATYTPGISERRNNNSTYYHSDLKNTTAQTASNETVSGTNVYDAFGNLLNYTGDWNGPFAYGGAFGYQTDDDSGLMLLGHRYYDSSTGRFLSRDPIGDGNNWYAYCGNNPLKFVDYFGLYKVVVRGNDEAVPLSGLGYWWTKPPYMDFTKDKLLDKPSRGEVVAYLIGATYFYFWGHGGGGELKLGKEYLSLEDVLLVAVLRGFLRIPKMKKTELRACESVSTAIAVNVWLLIAEEVEGYPGLTGYINNYFDWGINPSMIFTEPVKEDPQKNAGDTSRKKKERTR
jgi:RHS repeat-associated protein